MKTGLLVMMFLWVLMHSFVAEANEAAFKGVEFQPKDGSTADAELSRFIQELRQAVKTHDIVYLKAVLAVTFRGSLGPDEAVTPDFSDYGDKEWTDLATALQGGGAFMGDEYCIPYLFARFPETIDPLNHQFVAETAPVRKTPDARGDYITTLKNVIVRTDYGSPNITVDKDGVSWAKIYLDDTPAFIPSVTLHSPYGFRACFVKEKSGWRIGSLISGGD